LYYKSRTTALDSTEVGAPLTACRARQLPPSGRSARRWRSAGYASPKALAADIDALGIEQAHPYRAAQGGKIVTIQLATRPAKGQSTSRSATE
jgi:hypothetical protein